MEQESPIPTKESGENTNRPSFTYNPNGTPPREKGSSVTSIVALIILALIAIGVIGTGFIFWISSPSLH